jgi:hypothetical protein
MHALPSLHLFATNEWCDDRRERNGPNKIVFKINNNIGKVDSLPCRDSNTETGLHVLIHVTRVVPLPIYMLCLICVVYVLLTAELPELADSRVAARSICKQRCSRRATDETYKKVVACITALGPKAVALYVQSQRGRESLPNKNLPASSNPK